MEKSYRSQDRRQKILTFYEEMPLNKDFPILLEDVYTQDDAPITQLHRHKVIEIGHCLSGSGIFNIQNTYVPYSAGDVILMSRNTFHFAQSQRGTVSTWRYAFFDIDALMAKFLPVSVETSLTEIFYKKFGHVYSSSEYPEINRLVRSIISEMGTQVSFYRFNTIAHLVELLVLINRKADSLILHVFGSGDYSVDFIERLSPAISFIQRHYNEKIHVDQLAELCHMSDRSFLRHFKHVYDMSPYEYIIEVRLTMVCQHLKTTDQPVSYIAGTNGFGSFSSLNRQFHKKFNVSPSVWRKTHKLT